jgi:Cys-tRNA(Pro) deacylase
VKIRGEKDVLEALLAAGYEPVVSRFDSSSETAEASAALLGVETVRIVKSLIFVAKGAAKEKPVVALVPGDRRADMKAVAAELGVKKVRFASPEMVLEWSGFQVGAVPPVGHIHPMTILMDEGLPRDGFIYPAAGELNNAFETTFEDLAKMTGARVCSISKALEV